MMTPEQSKKWFAEMRQCAPKTVNFSIDSGITTDFWEQGYLAFEARILQTFKRESACNCLINVPAEKIEGEK
jgi:regulation of enolase protein 1 (concanavalin A-like superfamily)